MKPSDCRLTLRIKPELKKDLGIVSEALGCSRNELAIDGIEKEIKKYKKALDI